MSKKSLVRVIAKLDIKGPNLIKGLQFDGHRVLGTAEEFAEKFYLDGIDELIYQDTVATLYGRNGLLEIVSATAGKIFIPLTVAGGIRHLDDIRDALKAGADKVAINTAATKDIQLITQAAKEFGSQCIVSSIEAFAMWDGHYKLWTDYGREVTEIDAFEWAYRVAEAGAGEILLTSIDRDGMGVGYDNEMTCRVSESVPIPVIACGGAGSKVDFSNVIKHGCADAVCAASCFHYYYATSKKDRKTMQSDDAGLRMGVQIDSGNIDFLNDGYGGEQAIMVEPLSINEVKQHLHDNDVVVRL